MKTLRQLKKLKNFNFIDFATSIIDKICPFKKPSSKGYSNKYFFICLINFVDTHVSWTKYEGTKNHPIRGKYLNEIHNKYCKLKVYDKIHEELVNKYLKRDREPKLKIQIIDSTFIANKIGTSDNDYLLSDKEKQQNIKIREENKQLPLKERKKERKFIDHNRYNGRKKYFKKDIITDSYGFIYTHHISSSKRADSQSLEEVVNKLPFNFNTLKNSKINRYKQIFLTDSGYGSKINKNFLIKKGYIPIIKYNKRNTKNKKILKDNEMNAKQKKIYKKRVVVEHSFSWIKNRPIINQNYEKTIRSYNGLFSLVCSLINSKRI